MKITGKLLPRKYQKRGQKKKTKSVGKGRNFFKNITEKDPGKYHSFILEY